MLLKDKHIKNYTTQLTIIFCCLFSYFSFCQLEFRGVSPSSIAKPFEFTYTSDSDYQDAWGGHIESADFLLQGNLELIEEDTIGCGNYSENLTNKIAFIYRGECSFFEKIYYAQEHGAKGVVIINNIFEELFFMTGGQTSYQVNIPAILISKIDGEILKTAMKDSIVEVIITNMQNFYENNLSIENEYSLIPRAYATPQLTIDAENPFQLELGAFVLNRGSNDVSGALLHATVTYNDSILIECSSYGSIPSEDTVYFNLPLISFDSLKIGKYQIKYYTDIVDIVDQDPYSDTLIYYFKITENRFSLCPLDSLNEPISNHYTTSSETNLFSFTQCVKYENSHANKVAAEGILFSLQDEYYSLNQEEILISCFQWDNQYDEELTNLNDNFSELFLIEENYFVIEGNPQMENIYAPFSKLIQLENNRKYLFCITPISTPDLLIGYTKDLDYSLNNYAFSEIISPIEIVTFMGSQPNWFNGFSSGISPGIAINFVNSNLLDLDKRSTKINAKLYPNPVNDLLTVSIEKSLEIEKIEVIDVMGKIVLTKDVTIINDTIIINLENLDKGMYLVKITSNSNQENTFNIIKQ